MESRKLARGKSSKTIRPSIALLAALALSACVSPVDVFTPLPTDEVGRIGISQIDVTLDPAVAHPEMEAILQATLDEAIRGCAVGDLQRRLTVQIDDFQEQNVAMTFLVGSNTNLSGQVTFLDPRNGSVVGDYYIQVGRSGGGLIGAAVMGDARYNLPSSFAEEICDTILGQPTRGSRPQNVDGGREGNNQTAKSQTQSKDQAPSQATVSPRPGATEIPPVATPLASMPVSVLEQGKVKVFMRRNDGTLRSRLRAYNQSRKIGQDRNSQFYSILTVDSVDVLAVDGTRARVQLGFSSGARSAPTTHKYIYDVRFRPGDIDFITHRDPVDDTPPPQSWLAAFQGEPAPFALSEPIESAGGQSLNKVATSNDPAATPEVTAPTPAVRVSPEKRFRIKKYFDTQATRAKAGLRRYNEKHNIGQGGYFDDHRILLINSVEVVAADDDVFKIKVGLSVGNLWSSSYFNYLYTARLVGNSLQVLEHKEL